MAADLKALEEQALRLPPEQRVQLADRLLASLFKDHEIESAWIEEVERRISHIEHGRSSLVPLAESLARARAAVK